MVSFEIEGSVDDADTFISKLTLFINAPSLGGVESLVTRPVQTSHSGMSPKERMKSGIKDELIRLSIGIEDAEDLIADLDQALEKAMSGRDICVICRIIQQTQNHQNGVPDEAILADILSPLIPLSPIDIRVLDVSCESSYCVIDPCSIFIIEQLSPPSPPPRLVV